MRAMRAALLASILACVTAFAPSHAAESSGYRLIINPRNPATDVDRRFLEDAFLKKTTRWGTGDVILPVDAGGDSPVRRTFSEDVLGRSVATVKSYWQQRIFAGRDLPPPELPTDAAVVKYVLEHPGAVGYIAAEANLGGAKILIVK